MIFTYASRILNGMPEANQSLEQRFPPIIQTLKNGLSFYRLAYGEQLEELCDDLDDYMDAHDRPKGIVMRDVGAERTAPAIQMINSNEVTSHSILIGKVPVHEALQEIYRGTLSLDHKLRIGCDTHALNIDRVTNTEYITIQPIPRDLAKLKQERSSILNSIERAAKQPGLLWRPRKLDITMAAIEEHIPSKMNDDIIRIIREILPIEVVLQEAIHNPRTHEVEGK